MTQPAAILIVDDEAAIRRLLGAALVRAGYRVIEADNAHTALERLGDAECVLLDLGLPDRDGLELLPLIRQRSRAAVIVVSVREATDEKVAALDLGAADYVTKPFDSEELLARIRAALRNRLAAEGARSNVTAGEIEIDLADHRILRAGCEVHLTPKEFALIAELARFPGRAITHRQLLRAIWPDQHEGQIEYLRMLVRGVRLKLEADPTTPRLILNELGVGYRLVAD